MNLQSNNTVNTRYQGYDVLKMMDQWDSHTKEIVRKRMGPFPEPDFFTDREARYIAIIARHITYEYREAIIKWIVYHFDQKLSNRIGESQRKKSTPPEDVLVKDGLEVLDHVSRLLFGQNFGDLEEDRQFEILSDLQKGKAPKVPEWGKIPQKDLFNKLVSEIVSAYYSHPAVWSEIGYGGPVYPKVYVRIEQGLTDPWEAKRHGE